MGKWILVMDSGIGGSWTLKCLQNLMPSENFLFFMDKLNAPYGNKPFEQLNKIVAKNVKKIREKYQIKMIVLACNTVSCVCYDRLKEQNADLPIVKIQPQVDIKKFAGKPTLILATDNTAKFSKVVLEATKQNNIFIESFGTLAKQIDENQDNFDAILPFLEQNLSKYKQMHIQNIVLGCTHYNFIRPQLKRIFGDAIFFESSDEVAKECKNVLKKSNMLKDNDIGSTITFCEI